MGIKGVSSSVVINDGVSGTDILRATQAMDEKEAGIKEAVQRLAVKWSADDIIRANYAMNGSDGEILVHPPVAYDLARKCPFPSQAVEGVTKIASKTGGKVPLHMLVQVVGNWSALRSML